MTHGAMQSLAQIIYLISAALFMLTPIYFLTSLWASARERAGHVAMVLGTKAPGRPLVILLRDGDDTASDLSASHVLESAQRTGAVVSVVLALVQRRNMRRAIELNSPPGE